MDRDRGRRVDQHQKADEAEQPLDPFERQHPDGDDQHHDGKRRPTEIRSASKHLEHKGNPADLGRAGDQANDDRGGQGQKADGQAQPLAHESKDRLLGDGRHSPAHLAEDDDAQRRQAESPQQRHAEPRSGLCGEGHLADVDETADGGHDAKDDLTQPAQGSAP